VSEADKLPPAIRYHLALAVSHLQQLAETLDQGRAADRMFSGGGRYEADAYRNSRVQVGDGA
jgi:hypothetical protein